MLCGQKGHLWNHHMCIRMEAPLRNPEESYLSGARIHSYPRLVWASEQWNLTVEPSSHPSSRPFVIDGSCQSLSLAFITFGMEIDASILCQHVSIVDNHLLQLVVKLIRLAKPSVEGTPPKLTTTQLYFDSCPMVLRVSWCGVP
jgi:hypothetical protein